VGKESSQEALRGKKRRTEDLKDKARQKNLIKASLGKRGKNQGDVSSQRVKRGGKERGTKSWNDKDERQ